MTAPIRLVLVDHDTLFRRCLADQLQHDPGLQVVGQAATTAAALAQVRSLQPDVVVLDPVVPDGGLQLVAELCRVASACAVLVLTLGDDTGDASSLLRAGARGYLHKNCESCDLEDIALAIRRVHTGELLIRASARKPAQGTQPAAGRVRLQSRWAGRLDLRARAQVSSRGTNRCC
jgi:two-component system, NarL family, response regulator DevR